LNHVCRVLILTRTLYYLRILAISWGLFPEKNEIGQL